MDFDDNGTNRRKTIKNIFGSACLTLAFILAIFAGSGQAAASDERQWWGASDATPEPLRGAENSGYWWWPDTPKTNAEDSELWGNPGVVYSEYEPPKPPPPPKRVVAAASNDSADTREMNRRVVFVYSIDG